MTDKERYATIGTWAEVFRKEGVQIDDLTIRRHLELAKAVAETARARTGRLIQNGFYAESDVRKACVELLKVFPQADADNVIYLGGETYRTVNGWMQNMGLKSKQKIKARFEKANIQGVKGRMSCGNLRLFYSESDFRSVCADVLQNPEQADDEGFVKKGNICYAPIGILADHLQVAETLIRKVIENVRPTTILGQSRIGHILTFYSESEVRDYLEALPQANEEDSFVKDGEVYRLAKDWADVLKINRCTILRRIAKAGSPSITGRRKMGSIDHFFSESSIRSACGDMPSEALQIDDNGTLTHLGQLYGTATFFAGRLNLSAGFIGGALRKANATQLALRSKRGRRSCVFLVSEAESFLAKYLEDMPKVNKDSYCDIDGERYWTLDGWSRSTGASIDGIRRTMRHVPSGVVQGRGRMGRVVKLYKSSVLEEYCSRLLQKYPRADEDNCLFVNGKGHRTLVRLSKMLGVGVQVLKVRFRKNNIEPLRAMASTGNLRDFFPESAARQIASDFLAECPRGDRDGFLSFGGLRYGTSSALAQFFGVSHTTVIKRLGIHHLQPIRGKGITGKENDYYSEAEVRGLCADLIAKRQKSDD